MQDEQDRTDGANEASLAGESLSVTIRELSARLLAAGPLPKGDDYVSFQWRELRKSAAERGRVFPYDEQRWVDAKGGSEHSCVYHERLQRWEKVTKEMVLGGGLI